MRPVLAPGEMAAADRATIEGGVPSLDLMERAGAAVARAALRVAGGAYGKRFVVVCGKGSNAGDGFVAARHLARRGAHPVVVLLEDEGSLRGDALVNLRRLRGIRLAGAERLGVELTRAAVVVDAIVGTGFRGVLHGAAAAAVEAINRSNLPVVAVDVPSGVDGGSGRVEGPAVRAAITVAMGAVKAGLLLHPGSDHAGEVQVADIGIDASHLRSRLSLAEASDVAAVLGLRPATAHKRSVGTVLVVAGSVGMSGAAALAARGALRAGAGLVTMAVPASLAVIVDQTTLEATTLPLPETAQGTVEPSGVDAVLARQADAVALGPGLSTHPETVEFVRKLVTVLDRPLVVDADALNALPGPEVLAARPAPTLITPHPGELGRLLGLSTEVVSADRLGVARAAAARGACTVLLKGYRTIVADPGGAAVIVDVGGPALATGGSGDVLTGVAAALLAGGAGLFDAGWCAAWVHGRAGDLLARRVGIRGTVAGDLPGAVAEVLRGFEAREARA